MSARFLLCFGLISFFPNAPTFAQVHSLSEVPDVVRQPKRGQLINDRQALRIRLLELQSQGQTFNADCSSVKKGSAADATCKLRYSQLESLRNQYVTDADNFNNRVKATAEEAIAQCTAALSRQLARDKKALETQQKTIAMGLDELEKWTKDNEQAENDALRAATNLLLGSVGAKLAEKEKPLRSFKGWLTRYKTQMRDKNIPFEALESKVERAAHGYVSAAILVTGGRASETAKTFNETRTLIKSEIATIGEHVARSDASVRALLEDKEIKTLLESDSAGREFASTLVVPAAHSQEIEKLSKKLAGPAADLTNFLFEYGYNAAKWSASRARIIQQYSLSDLELKAVDALKKQIECTVEKLNACKAGLDFAAC